MIFKEWQKVLSGEQTQTRVLVKRGEEYFPADYDNILCGVYRNLGDGVWRVVYYGGQTLAVQSGFGKPAVARIEITDIRREDVRCISDEDVKAEGFDNRREFWRLWIKLHDESLTIDYSGERSTLQIYSEKSIYGFMSTRPAASYDAWKLTFRLVQP